MPVPVPRHSDQQPAHPVFKRQYSADSYSNSFQSLVGTLPLSPTGPPPSFGTREEWINSLPTWRRTKPRRIWEDDCRSAESEEDFHQGLAFVDNTTVIKGSRAEACIPPLASILGSMPYSQSSPADLARLSRYDEMEQCGENDICSDIAISAPAIDNSRSMIEFEKGAFTPVFEEQSPLDCADSSPMEPTTPPDNFVDRSAVAASYPVYSSSEYTIPKDVNGYSDSSFNFGYSSFHLTDVPKEPAPTHVAEIVTPAATSGYKRLAEPLSEWVAGYVWKICIGTMKPQSFYPHNSQASSPPEYLSSSIHSLLLSTLLQPSAVFLAMWYICRLPVIFDSNQGTEDMKDLMFRSTVMGDSQERDSLETGAPFRLIVLGFMLANKWLDDHTFSNKTWHTISNIPIYTLNRLEYLALDIFRYDLSISSQAWNQWLSHLVLYNTALTSPRHPQPISRPSTNPHAIIRIAIEDIIQAPVACGFDTSPPQPVFLGLEERRREKLEKEQCSVLESIEIDLDEDGPLREEYIPRRRISTTVHRDPPTHNISSIHPENRNQNWNGDIGAADRKLLPPPAKWSPAGDEPILRERNRLSSNYVAVQANPRVSSASYHIPSVYPSEPGHIGTNSHWSFGNSYANDMQSGGRHRFYDCSHGTASIAYNSFHLPPLLPISHHRSHSLNYGPDGSQLHSHMRSLSQNLFDYRCSDLRMTANEPAIPQDTEMHWAGHYSYSTAAFAPQYQSIWLT